MTDAKLAFAALVMLLGGMGLAGHFAQEEDNAEIQYERPHSMMGWKTRKATQDEAEAVLIATRERMAEVERETKAQMEAQARGRKK